MLRKLVILLSCLHLLVTSSCFQAPLFLATHLTILLTKPVLRYQNCHSGITTCSHKHSLWMFFTMFYLQAYRHIFCISLVNPLNNLCILYEVERTSPVKITCASLAVNLLSIYRSLSRDVLFVPAYLFRIFATCKFPRSSSNNIALRTANSQGYQGVPDSSWSEQTNINILWHNITETAHLKTKPVLKEYSKNKSGIGMLTFISLSALMAVLNNTAMECACDVTLRRVLDLMLQWGKE